MTDAHDDALASLDAWLADDLEVGLPDDLPGPVRVEDREQADRFLRAMARLDDEQVADETLRNAEVARLDAWLEDRSAGRLRRRQWIEDTLAGFMAAVRRSDPLTKTLRLPWGTLAARARPTRLVTTGQVAAGHALSLLPGGEALCEYVPKINAPAVKRLARAGDVLPDVSAPDGYEARAVLIDTADEDGVKTTRTIPGMHLEVMAEGRHRIDVSPSSGRDDDRG